MSYPCGIIKEGGKYRVRVNIQDGHEDCGVYDSEEEARKQWKDAERVLNGNKRKKKDAPLYELRPVIEQEYVRIK